MRTIEITVSFIDKKGIQTKDNLVMTVNDEDSEDKVMTWASDLAIEWFYNVAYETAKIIWDENGGGTDYEFEIFYEKYIETCDFQWNFKKNYHVS